MAPTRLTNPAKPPPTTSSLPGTTPRKWNELITCLWTLRRRFFALPPSRVSVSGPLYGAMWSWPYAGDACAMKKIFKQLTLLTAALTATATTTAAVAPAPQAEVRGHAATRLAPATPRPTGSLQQQVDAIHTSGVVSVVAEVTTPERRRSARAGVADLRIGRPVPLGAEFRAGSVTKTFVAAVMLQLVGEGRVSLDDRVERWLPGVVRGNGNDGGQITVRQLLQHTSGIYNYTREIPALAGAAGYLANRFRTYSPEDLVALAMRHAPNFPPGTKASYSNTNYILAGMIIKRVTGRSWAQEVNARIVRPLGLRHTHTPGTFPFIPGPHAKGYANFGTDTTTDVTVINPSVADAAGSILSTTHDLTRFYTALVDGRLLAPAQLEEMTTTVAAPELEGAWPGARYGLGLGWFPLSCGGAYVGHPGDVPGYHTWNGITLDADRAVVVSVTGDGSPRTQQAVNTLTDHQLCGTD
jgi:D-alanyl-D-alanine carboxypeptidase